MKIKWKKLLALGLAFSMAVGSFSVSGMTAMAEEASGEVISQTSKTEYVVMAPGSTITLTNEDGYYESAVIGDESGIVTSATTAYGKKQVTSEEAFVSGAEYLISSSRSKEYLTSELEKTNQNPATDGLKLVGYDANAPKPLWWKIEKENGKYRISRGGSYLNIGNDTAKVDSDTTFDIELGLYKGDNSRDYGCWSIKGTHCLNQFGGSGFHCAAGYQTSSGDDGCWWQIWKVTTDITVTAGDTEGTTTVSVGDINYHIYVRGTQNRELVLYEGSTLEVFQKTDDYSSWYADGSLDTAYVGVGLESDISETEKLITNINELEDGKEYIIQNVRCKKYLDSNKNSGNNGLALIAENNVLWTLQVDKMEGDALYTTLRNGYKYLDVVNENANAGNMVVKKTVISYHNGLARLANEEQTMYLNDFGGVGTRAAGYTKNKGAATDDGSMWNIYEPVHKWTKVTFTGKEAGTSYVVVGDVTYKITVKDDEKTEKIELLTGETITVTNPYGNFENFYLNGVDNQFVTATLSGKNARETQLLASTADIVYGGIHWIDNYRSTAGSLLKNEATGNKLKLGVELNDVFTAVDYEKYSWEIDKVETNTESIGVPVVISNRADGNEKWLNIGRESASTGDKNTLYIEDHNGYVLIANSPKKDGTGHVLNNHGGMNKAQVGGDSYDGDVTTDDGNYFNIYAAPHGSTEVDFTGKEAGKTSVTIGNVTYNITVTEPSYVADFGLPMTFTMPTDAYTLDTGNYTTEVASVKVVAGNVVTYTLNKTLDGADIVKLLTTDGKTATVKIYPATSVYYDASFAEYTNYVDTIEEGNPTPTESPIPWEKSWSETTSAVQSATAVGEVDNYGYDSVYGTATSGAMEVATSATIGDVATFEFTGTAVDVYMNCTSETGKGLVRITVRNGDTDQVEKMLVTDTEFKLEEDAEGVQNRSTAAPVAYGVPVVSIGGLKPGNHTVTINHIRYAGEDDSKLIIDGFRVYNTLQTDVDGVYAADNEANPVYETLRNSLLASLTADYKYPIYTENNPFYFPTTTKKNQTLEAEYATLINYVEENEEYALNVAKGTWASNGKFVNSLNNGDKMEIPYFAEKAGIYEVKVTYRSGDTANKLIWVEKEEKITTGEIEAGSSNSATANETRTFELKVVEPGAGVLVFVPDENKSPQLDKFEIHLKKVYEDVAAVKPTVTPAETPTAGKYAEQIASGLLKDILGKEGSATGVAIVSNGQYADLDLQNFIENSSKNEIHLYPGQSLVFNLATAGKLQVGLRALNEAVTYKVNNGTETALKSNVDMFYPITVGDNGTVTITNTGASGVLAVTKLKMSGNGTQANAIVFRALTEKDFTNALVALDVVEGNLGVTGAPEEWGGEGTSTPTPSASPTEEVIPSPTEEVLPSPTETEAPVPTETEEPQPTETEAPVPTATEEPQPTETEAPVPTATEEPQPTETEAPTPSETETPEATKSVTEVFDDVYSDWYVSYVQFVYENGLMTGIKGTTEFQPDANITKAQVAQVLYNMEGQPMVTNLRVIYELSDIPEIEWYTRAVAWAYNRGIVTGDTNAKKFFPNADVTREQLALMMYRYAEWKKYDVSATSDFAGLQNAENVSNWAAEGMSWAVGTGLISGVEKDGVKDLAPQGNATRAQMAAILQRFCENIK